MKILILADRGYAKASDGSMTWAASAQYWQRDIPLAKEVESRLQEALACPACRAGVRRDGVQVTWTPCRHHQPMLAGNLRLHYEGGWRVFFLPPVEQVATRRLLAREREVLDGLLRNREVVGIISNPRGLQAELEELRDKVARRNRQIADLRQRLKATGEA